MVSKVSKNKLINIAKMPKPKVDKSMPDFSNAPFVQKKLAMAKAMLSKCEFPGNWPQIAK